MADDQADISGMPDPGTIGLDPAKQVDPTAEMPDPANLYQAHYGDAPRTKEALDDFMANPPEKSPPLTARKAVSAATGIPRAIAGYAAAVPAAVASIAGQGVGALGAALDPDNAASYLRQGRDRGREWAAKVNNLANYIPATKQGAEFSEAALEVPGGAIKDTAGTLLQRSLPDNAYQAVSDVAQDVGTDLPALGVPGAVRAGARAGARVAKAVTPTPKAAPAAPIVPPVGKPISGDTLRAAPNPIPAPEGTLHRSSTEDGRSPAAPPTASAEPTAAPTVPTLPETDTAPLDMSLSPDQRAIVREGVAARRANDQRGSVRLFNSPAEEGPKETPAPEQQTERAGHLDAIDQLSGGLLPERRTSALTGNYNATGDDYQAKEVGSPQMRKQLADENAAMHAATENVHDSVGSEFENSVDSQTLGDRGRVTRGAIQGIEGWFDKATDQMYDTAREQNQGRPIESLKRVKEYLDDDSNFTNDAEIGLQRAAKQRMERLWTTGDPDKGTPPGSVNAAERLREFLNEKGKNPSAMGVAGDLKNHLDLDVAEHGGPGLFQTARALRRHSYQMLEEPTGIKKLLTPGDSQGINHAIPEHKVMDYIADLPREQHEHVLNVLRAGAHLGGGELAEGSAAALREIQAHTISRMHNAARNADGSWNARKFYNAADRYARNASATFADRPDILKNLKTINDAGNTLHMDKHYPGAGAQIERTSALGHTVEAGGKFVSGLAHDLPIVGRMVGRALENSVEGLGGKISESNREKAIAKRIVDRTGKQRGAVGDLSQRDAVTHETDNNHPDFHSYKTPNGGYLNAYEKPELGVRQSTSASIPKDERGKGWGTRMLQRAVDDAHEAGQKWRSDKQVSDSQVGAYKNLMQLGYPVKMTPHEHLGGAYHAYGDHLFEVSPKKSAVPSGQRGSFSFQNDNALNNATASARGGQRGVGNERNPRSEFNANRQIAGNPAETAERADILRRLSGQRGSVKIMNTLRDKMEDVGEHVHGFDQDVMDKATDIYDRLRHAPKQIRDKARGIMENLGERHAGFDQDSMDKATDVRDKLERLVGIRGPRDQRGSARVMNDESPDAANSNARTAEEGAQLNVGLHQGTEGQPGFKKMSKQEVHAAIESTGAKVVKSTVLQPGKHAVQEPTLVATTDRPLSPHEVQSVLEKTKQSAIPQRTGQGDEEMHVALGHEQTAKEQGWDKFSPDYFMEHSGQSMSAGPAQDNPHPPHPAATVKDARQSKFPGIYDDPKTIMDRLGEGKPESPHLKEVFGVTRKDLHDSTVARGDVEPKTPIPGITTKGKGSAHAANVTTPENAERLRSIISAYKEHDPSGYHGMVGWYEMDPMYKSIKKILGSDARAGDVYHKLNSYTSYASPMSSVDPEIRRGTAAATLAAEGKFGTFAKQGGMPQERAPSALKAKNFELGNEGHAMHSTAHAGAMSRFNETGQEANAVKTGTYRRSSDAPLRPGSDHQNTVPVGDSHWARGAGLADVRGAKAFEGSAEGSEMKTLAPWYHDQVARHPDVNLPSTSAQAVQWGALSKETGVESPVGAPKLEIWADQIAAAAKKAGVEPKEMWRRIVKRLAAQ